MASYYENVRNLSELRKEKIVLNDKNEIKKGCVVKIMSYNILAQTLLERHPELYEKQSEMYLQWDHRKELLFQQLRDSFADFLCLQEVEEDVLNDLSSYLEKYGYKYLYKKRTGSNIDGCAIFYNETRFNVSKYAYLEYFKPSVSHLDRHNIGIVATFAYNDDSNKKIVIATTHILFNVKRHDIKLMQIQMLLTEIERQVYINNKNSNPIVITGDFNFDTTSPVYDFIINGFFNLFKRNYRSLLPCETTRLNLNHSHLLPPHLGITDKCIYVREIEKRNNLSNLYFKDGSLVEENTNFTIKGMFYSNTLTHNLKLFNIIDNIENYVSTYHDRWICVDFIFYNKNNLCSGTNKKKLELISYLELPSVHQSDDLPKIPNKENPSDHLPTVATFLLR